MGRGSWVVGRGSWVVSRGCVLKIKNILAPSVLGPNSQ